MSLHPRHPLANMRDRWRFQLEHMPQGDARAMLRRCLDDVTHATGEALLGVMAAVEEEDQRAAALRGLVEAAGWLLDAADCLCHVTREPPCYVCVARERVRAAESAMGGERHG